MPIHNKVTEAELKAIAHMWGNGLSDSAIAKQLGRGDATIKRARKQLGVARNYAMTPEKLQSIKELNQQGKTDLEISKLTKISRKVVGGHRKRMGLPVIHYGGTHSPFTKQLAETIEVRQSLGSSTTEIAREMGCTGESVRHNLKRFGVKTLTLREAVAHSIDESCFAEINDASAYWLGFLMADGCNNGGISVNLSERDAEHLGKLKEFCKYQGPIRKVIYKGKVTTIAGREARPGDQVLLSSHSMKISADLTRWGVTPRKTFTATAHPDLAHNRHFWRGVVDGDGSVSKRKPVAITLCGSVSIINQFADYVYSVIGRRPRIRQNVNIMATAVYGANARAMLKLLYTDCEYFLDRKMKLAQMHLNAKWRITKVPDETRKKIFAMKADGLNGYEIAKKLNIHFVTAYAYLRKGTA